MPRYALCARSACLTMPRRPRIHLPGLPIHLVQRGHNRDTCLFADEVCLADLDWPGEALKKSGCALHAYVLMTNHAHLLLTPPSAQEVSRLVISLGRRYVQHINTTQRAYRHVVGQAATPRARSL